MSEDLISNADRDLFTRFLGDEAIYEHCCRRCFDGKTPEDNPNGLSFSERLAVWIYTSADGQWYKVINDELWDDTCSTETAFVVGQIESALEKIPRHNGIVYRGFNREADFDEFVDGYFPGQTVKWFGLTSSTLDAAQAFAGNILFTIRSQNGRVLGPYAHVREEAEVLFRSGSRYRVTYVERRDDSAVIELEEHSS